jgi:hypothetical protein
VVNATRRPLYPCVRNWMGHRPRLDGCRISRRRRDSIHRPAFRYIDCAVPARLYPVLLHNGHIFFSQSFQIQKSPKSIALKREAARSSEASEQTFIKNNVRTRRDLDSCCVFGCSQDQISTPKPDILFSVYP